jgi:hypothetical protein
MRLNEDSRSGLVLKLTQSYKKRREQNGKLTIGGAKEIFAGITKDIVVEYQRSKEVGTAAAAISKEYRHKVLNRAECWAQMRNKHDLRAWTTRLEEVYGAVLMTLHESITPMWFIAAFENKGLRIVPTSFTKLEYNMQDIQRVVHPSTGVPKFMASGWETNDNRRECFAWMKMGCTRHNCTYDHRDHRKGCLRNIHMPERVSNHTIKRTKKNVWKKNIKLVRFRRACGQRVNTRQQKKSGRRRPTGKLAQLSLPDEQGRGRVRELGKENRQNVDQHQRTDSRRRTNRKRGSWRARARGAERTAQLQHMYTGRVTKGGNHNTKAKAGCRKRERGQCRLKKRHSIAFRQHKEEKT